MTYTITQGATLPALNSPAGPLPVSQDLFPPCGEPRNHAEEIANALKEREAREEQKRRARIELEC